MPESISANLLKFPAISEIISLFFTGRRIERSPPPFASSPKEEEIVNNGATTLFVKMKPKIEIMRIVTASETIAVFIELKSSLKRIALGIKTPKLIVVPAIG